MLLFHFRGMSPEWPHGPAREFNRDGLRGAFQEADHHDCEDVVVGMFFLANSGRWCGEGAEKPVTTRGPERSHQRRRLPCGRCLPGGPPGAHGDDDAEQAARSGTREVSPWSKGGAIGFELS